MNTTLMRTILCYNHKDLCIVLGYHKRINRILFVNFFAINSNNNCVEFFQLANTVA